MAEYNPCVNCEFYNKPYWSVVNPCENCPKMQTSGYIVTITEPMIEYAPVVQGKWLDIHEGQTFRCSHCFAWVKADCVEGKSGPPRYCPNCGAKMDGGTHG